MSSLTIFLVAVLFQGLQAAPTPTPPPTCNGTIIIKAPTDISRPYYWPAGWYEDMDPPPHTIDNVCSFVFSVPKGLYAKLVMKGKMDGDSYIFLNDDAHYNQYVYDTNLEPYFFVNDKFYVSLVSGSKIGTAKFGMKVVWSRFPFATPQRIALSTGVVSVQRAVTAQTGVVIMTDPNSRVSLLALPKKFMDHHTLRNTLVFDGPSYYSNYTGNLYKIFASRKQFVSTGNNLTLITFEPQNAQDFYIAQDYRDTKNINEYTTVVCDDSMDCPVTLDASFGKAAAFSVSDGGETLKNAQIEKAASLSVYSDAILDKNLLDTYSSATSKSNLPHKYNVNIRQYVVDSGVATLDMSRK